MDKEEFYKIAKIIEIEIQSGKNYSQCIGMGYFTERFNTAWEQVKKLNLQPVSGSALQPQYCKDCMFHNNKHELHHEKCKACYFHEGNQQSNFERISE